MNLHFVISSALLMTVQWNICQATFNTTVLDTASSLKFEALSEYKKAHWIIHHMEVDLFTNDGSIIHTDTEVLMTTNGSHTSVVKNFRKKVRGFKQLNSTTIAVSVHTCIQIFDRVTGAVRTLAGVWGRPGYADGIPGRFRYTGHIEIDQRDPTRILFADQYNRAIRAIDLSTGYVTTIAKGSFWPNSMAWYNNQLLFTDTRGVRKITWDETGQPNVSRVAGRKYSLYSYFDGSFESAEFLMLTEILRISDHHYLVSDFDNYRIRLLDMKRKLVLPVCFGVAECRRGTATSRRTYSLLMVDDELYLGQFPKILKARSYDG